MTTSWLLSQVIRDPCDIARHNLGSDCVSMAVYFAKFALFEWVYFESYTFCCLCHVYPVDMTCFVCDSGARAGPYRSNNDGRREVQLCECCLSMEEVQLRGKRARSALYKPVAAGMVSQHMRVPIAPEPNIITSTHLVRSPSFLPTMNTDDYTVISLGQGSRRLRNGYRSSMPF